MRVVILLSLLTLACDKTRTASPDEVVSAPDGGAIAAPAEARGSSAAKAGSDEKGAPVAGKVLERIEAAGYSYLRLQPAEVWVAVPVAEVALGTTVSLENSTLMMDFPSKTLGRPFDRIYFGTLAGSKAAATAPIDAPSPAPGQPAPVARAEGPDGRTIAEVFGQKAELKDRTVAVRGTVVKATSGVMGRNWLHLRDGSGTDDAKDDDLTITTLDSVAVGEVVLVKGAVHLDKDFGAGYAYAVIIEDASVSK